MIFRSKDPQFAKLLWSEAADGPFRFSARNFLLDEGVGDGRADSYVASNLSYLAARSLPGFLSGADWNEAHHRYLKGHVQLDRPAGSLPSAMLDPAEVAFCPETFRYEESLSSFGGADPGLHVLRLVDLRSLVTKASLAAISTEAAILAPPTDLSDARRRHIERLRDHHNHPDFARDTDP